MLRRLLRQLLTGAGQPRVSSASLQQALVLFRQRDYDAAIGECERIISRDPADPLALSMLGAIAMERGDKHMACERFEAALRAGGERLEALCNAAEANRQAGDEARALQLVGRALALEPDHRPALHIQALAYQSCWRMDEALAGFRRLAEQAPEFSQACASYLFLLLLLGEDPLLVRAAHCRWAAFNAESLRDRQAGHANTADPLRRLRVGYVSADFREHAISNFIEPILAQHDSARFEIYCYSSTERIDSITERLKSHVFGWRDIRWSDDDAVAALVRSDAIDILIDLSGHTSGNRLGVFARKPAPVQVSYLGYAATTGMSAMDSRLTDGIADPVDTAEPNYTERLLRLPNSLWCFRPDAAMPEPGPLPASRSGRITFGSLNSILKLTPQVIALWSRLLLSVPGSRLLLATVPEGEARERIVAEFAAHGVPASVLSIQAPMQRDRFWSLHAQIDIALDTWPCNGGATTCETLWSGVPVVSLEGRLFQSRAGSSLLSSVGLQELVAHSEDEYLSVARRLAHDLERLSQLRQGMRERMRASPLMDEKRFTLDLEALYQAAWRDWCERGRHV